MHPVIQFASTDLDTSYRGNRRLIVYRMPSDEAEAGLKTLAHDRAAGHAFKIPNAEVKKKARWPSFR